MNRIVSQGLCVTLVTVAAGIAAAALMRGDERVEELMERTHEGRRSPYRQVQAQAQAAQPAWATVATALPRLDAMARALRESPNAEIRNSADGYVDSVKELGVATRNRDGGALREAFAGLEQTCGDCHFDGGVGGELEDEHEHEHDEEEEREDD